MLKRTYILIVIILCFGIIVGCSATQSNPDKQISNERNQSNDKNAVQKPVMPTDIENGNTEEDLTNIGIKYLEQGDYDNALLAFFKILKTLDPECAITNYNIACTFSLKGNLDEALTYLEKAINLGYNYYNRIMKDPDLAPLKENEKFKVLMDGLRKKLTQY